MREVFVDPCCLGYTQFTADFSIDLIGEYDPQKDPGIELCRDENGKLWIFDGHNRATAARLQNKMVKVGMVTAAPESDIWSLIDG